MCNALLGEWLFADSVVAKGGHPLARVVRSQRSIDLFDAPEAIVRLADFDLFIGFRQDLFALFIVGVLAEAAIGLLDLRHHAAKLRVLKQVAILDVG